MNQKQLSEITTRVAKIQSKAERETAKLYLNELTQLKASIADMYEDFADKDGVVHREEMMKYGRLQKLEDDLIERIKVLTKAQVEVTQGSIEDSFQESYYSRGFTIEKAAGIAIFGLLAAKVIKSALYNDSLATKWTETINNDNNHLIRQVKQTVLSGLTQGATYNAMAKELTQVVQSGSDKAVRTVQTESHRASEDANLKTMERATGMGVIMKKRWLSTLDKRTRKTHQTLDGQTIEVDEYFVSHSGNKALAPCQFGVAAEDIRCRCTTIAIFEGLEPTVRRARDESNKGEIISYTNYPEWRNNLT